MFESGVVEVGHCAPQDVYGRVQVLGYGLEDEHVGQQDRNVPVELHPVVADHSQHLLEHVDAF